MTYNTNSSIHIIDSVEGVTALRNEWRQLQAHPSADIDEYLTLLASRPEILRPHVIVLKINDALQSILIGRLEWTRLDIGSGYARLSLPPVRCLTFVGGGPLGDASELTVMELVNSVEKSLKNKEADIAFFHEVDVDSSI